LNLVFFLVGVVTGGVVCYLYLQSHRLPVTDHALTLRVQALEEQLVALTAAGAGLRGASGRGTRPKKASVSAGKQERILALHHEGLENGEISQATGVPLGQVELLTRLHGKE